MAEKVTVTATFTWCEDQVRPAVKTYRAELCSWQELCQKTGASPLSPTIDFPNVVYVPQTQEHILLGKEQLSFRQRLHRWYLRVTKPKAQKFLVLDQKR